MTDQSRDKAWGFALFCDDARLEVGGKLSLMGLYQADMFFPNTMPMPILLPKIVVVINYFEIRGALKEDVSFKISFGNNLIGEAPALRKDIETAQAQAPKPTGASDEDKEHIFNIRLPIPLSPFRIDQPARLRVRAHYNDGKILRLGSMGISLIPEAEFQKMIGATAKTDA